MLISVVDKLAEKIYYKLNPQEVWKYLPGSKLKRWLNPGDNTKKVYEYISISSIDREKQNYTVDYYAAIYTLVYGFATNNQKTVEKQLNFNIPRKELEQFNHELISDERFNEGIKV